MPSEMLGGRTVGDEAETNAFVQQRPSATVLTPPGRGAIATILLVADTRGLQKLAEQARTAEIPFFAARNGQPIIAQELNRILFGTWGVEEVVACRTSEQTLEIHCHGGDAAVRRLLQNLADAGAAVDAPSATEGNPAWLRSVQMACSQWVGTRADAIHGFSAANQDSTAVERRIRAELVTAATAARTLRTAEFLWEQVEIGVPFWSQLETVGLPEQAAVPDSRIEEIRSQARHWSEFGWHLTAPWSVVIGGLPNVGKSSLINALLGYERAIVHDRPGTTRDVVSGETALAGWPVLLSDTAGQRESAEQLEAAGMELAIERLQQADLPLILIDSSQPRESALEQLLARFPHALVVMNKIDRPRHPDWETSPEVVAHISCSTGAGLEELLQLLTDRLVPILPPAGTILPITQRHLELLTR